MTIKEIVSFQFPLSKYDNTLTNKKHVALSLANLQKIM